MEALKSIKEAPVKLTDSTLVQRVLGGEKELFEILMRRYNQTLYRAVRSYLVAEKDIEDSMQDTYFKAYRNLYQYKGDASFSTWLVRIGINESLMRIRKHKNHFMLSTEGNDHIIQLPDTGSLNPENQAINHEIRVLVEKAIDRLPEKYRIIYVLREVEGMENNDISSCLGLSESNVKVRFHRAKNLLKEALYKISADVNIFGFGAKKCDVLVDRVMREI